MKIGNTKCLALAAAALAFGTLCHAQSTGPTAGPGALSFSYQVNAALPSPVKVTVSLPAASSSLPLSVTSVISTPQGWLTVTPDSGHAPLTLTVTVNPTGLTPGSYAGSITIDTTPGSRLPATVPVNLLISNPPSTMVLSPSASTTNYTPPPSGSSIPTLTFLYTTGTNATSPVMSELDVSSTGDIIPFNVTVGGGKTSSNNSWIRVSSSPTQLPSLATSGSAFPGSSSPIYITLDMATVIALDPGSYTSQITIAAVNSVNGSWTVAVTLVVSAGPPVMRTLAGATSPIYPYQLSASPTIDPVITINGDNFFSTSVVTMQLGTNPAITLPAILLSRKVLQATIKKDYLAPPITPALYPATWVISVTNPAPPNNPAQPPASSTLTITDPSLPSITGIVNAASYLTTSVWTGTAGANPVTAPNPLRSVAPREIISIFGQNLGPASISTATPSATPPSTTLVYPTTWNGVQVQFSWLDPTTTPATPASVLAPIIMTSLNQINVVVPKELSVMIGAAVPIVTIQVTNGAAPPAVILATVVREDPGIFTFAGLGQGPGAILDYDSSGVPTINSSKNAAARGSAIAIYVTGMGELLDPSWVNGAVLPSVGGAVKLADGTCRVDIDGQPAVVTYAGSSPGAIAGLVQVNAIVPPTSRTGASITITVSIGATATSRRTQPGVTFAVN
jgi:uncharacterized protein (TIGR03437 family)